MEIRTSAHCFYFWILLLFFIGSCCGQCTFPAGLRGIWESSDKGPLNFTEDAINSYPMPITVTVINMDFNCLERVNGTRYVLQSSQTFTLFGLDFRAYMCWELQEISSYMFQYQLGTVYDASTLQKVHFAMAGSAVTPSDVCNRLEPYAVSTFNTLVKPEAFTDGLVTVPCPVDLYHVFSNGTLTSADDTESCTNATLDVCSDRTQMSMSYDTSCDASLQLTADGISMCLMELTNETLGVTYLHVWNNDTSLANGVNRINCYAFEVDNETVTGTFYPGSCQDTQTTDRVPNPGLKFTYFSVTETCKDLAPLPDSTDGPNYFILLLGGLGVMVLLIVVSCAAILYRTKCCTLICVCRKQSVGHSEEQIRPARQDTKQMKEKQTQNAGDMSHLHNDRNANGAESKAMHMRNSNGTSGAFVARKPMLLGPMVEPYLQPPPKVSLLYEVGPRPDSGMSRLLYPSPLGLTSLDEM